MRQIFRRWRHFASVHSALLHTASHLVFRWSFRIQQRLFASWKLYVQQQKTALLQSQIDVYAHGDQRHDEVLLALRNSKAQIQNGALKHAHFRQIALSALGRRKNGALLLRAFVAWRQRVRKWIIRREAEARNFREESLVYENDALRNQLDKAIEQLASPEVGSRGATIAALNGDKSGFSAFLLPTETATAEVNANGHTPITLGGLNLKLWKQRFHTSGSLVRTRSGSLESPDRLEIRLHPERRSSDDDWAQDSSPLSPRSERGESA